MDSSSSSGSIPRSKNRRPPRHSSSVRTPHPENLQSKTSYVWIPRSKTPPSSCNRRSPRHPSPVGIPLSVNPQSTQNPPPMHSSTTPVGIPLSVNPQSTQNPPPLHSSSTPVGIPFYVNPQSTQNPPPMYSSSTPVGIPFYVNPQSTQNPPLMHSSSTPVGIPFYVNPQSTEPPANRQFPCTRSAGMISSDAEWNIKLSKLFHDYNFCIFMRGGECEDPFKDWYGCMHHAIYNGGNGLKCSALAGALRDCIFSNIYYYHPLFTYFWNSPRR